jgi:hypothetical protein
MVKQSTREVPFCFYQIRIAITSLIVRLTKKINQGDGKAATFRGCLPFFLF